MWQVYRKELLELVRDKKTLFFVIALPLVKSASTQNTSPMSGSAGNPRRLTCGSWAWASVAPSRPSTHALTTPLTFRWVRLARIWYICLSLVILRPFHLI